MMHPKWNKTLGAPIQRLLRRVPTDAHGDPLVGRPIYSFTLLCTLYCFGLFETVQNLKICSIWNLFRIWKFVPFEICSEFENLFHLKKCSKFENLFHLKICLEFQKLFHLKYVQNLKNCSIWNLFRISNFVPFEICLEFETVSNFL
jgi:hypothetical protein